LWQIEVYTKNFISHPANCQSFKLKFHMGVMNLMPNPTWQPTYTAAAATAAAAASAAHM
jgi:hypothetical protein